MTAMCKDCKWWNTYKGSPFGTGICRGAPPIQSAVIHNDRQMTSAVWPATRPDDWCGKFELECMILEQSEKLDGTIVQTIRLRDGTETSREIAPQP